MLPLLPKDHTHTHTHTHTHSHSHSHSDSCQTKARVGDGDEASSTVRTARAAQRARRRFMMGLLTRRGV